MTSRPDLDLLRGMHGEPERAADYIEKLEAGLRETHGTAQAMADLDSWIAEQCGMQDDGESWYVPVARTLLQDKPIDR